MKLSTAQRKWLLTIHILFASIMFGCMIAFLVLSIVAASTSNADVLAVCYGSMGILARTSVRASTIGTVVTGILLSRLTPWGFFRYYWLIAKELLTVAAAVLSLVSIQVLTLNAVEAIADAGAGALEMPSFKAVRLTLFAGIGAQLLALAAMFALSVFKPWGKVVRPPAGRGSTTAQGDSTG